MSILHALILGIIQGLTEFLPISSSGHLMLIENIFGLEGSNMFFNVLLHFATLTAVVIVFWKDVVYIIKHPFCKESVSIIIATIPTVILALVVKLCINEFSLVAFLGFGFLISSIIIFITSILQRKQSVKYLEISKKNALIVGIVQGFAVLPGISRSGSTICSSLLLGIDREKSAKFSFLISIPVIIGGLFFELLGGIKYGFGNINIFACIIGFLTAFIVAIFTIKLMMKIVKKGNWLFFAIYLFVLSVIVLLNQFLFCWF